MDNSDAQVQHASSAMESNGSLLAMSRLVSTYGGLEVEARIKVGCRKSRN